MRGSLLFLTLIGAMLLAFTGVVLAQNTSPSQQKTSLKQKTLPDIGTSPHLAQPGRSVELCPSPVEPGKARCFAQVRTDANISGAAPTTQNPSGYYPSDLQSAYNLPSETAGFGMTVAIVDAYDDPSAESDLQTYRNYFNLPACTTANGCFKKVDQRGGTNYPAFDKGWAGEIALDIDMVSAICPNCHILLVEADTSSTADLAAGVDEAASLGANAISNSYGSPEVSDEASQDAHYNHPGIAITASSGDNGYGDTEVPALLPHVIAVGGTRLLKDGSTARGWTEKVWGSGYTSNSKGGTGSGCSAYIPKPLWQTDLGCEHRTEGDVAVDADPNTGVAIFDSNEGGWGQFGGTSVSAPVIAAIYALAGNTFLVNDASLLYSPTASLYDVTSGSNGYYNGHSCIVDSTNSSVSGASSTDINQSVGSSGAKHHHKGHHHKRHHKGHHHSRAASLASTLLSKAYLCNGEPDYDAPTGKGTPNGIGAF